MVILRSMQFLFTPTLFLFLCAVKGLVTGQSNHASASLYQSFHGNELAQFERYVSFSTHVNATDIFDRNDACERSIVPERGFRFYNCRHTIRSHLETVKSIELYKHERDPNDKFKMRRYCDYSVQSPTLYVVNAKPQSRYLLSFVIKQHSCKEPLASKKSLQSGSTFEVHVQSHISLALCRSWDNFDSTYRVDCLMPLPELTASDRSPHSVSGTARGTTTASTQRKVREAIDGLINGPQCFDIKVVLHFEAYDSFYDVGVSDWSSLAFDVTPPKVPLRVCLTADTTPATGGQFLLNTHFNGNFWMRPVNITEVLVLTARLQQSQNHAGIGIEAPLHMPLPGEYHWRGGRKKYPKVSTMKSCLQHQTIFFVGESHMRYQFDITMDRYVDRLRVGRYHGNMNVSGISYADMTFSARMSQFIDDIRCPLHGARITYVLQTGSWDLQFFGPRGFISSAYQGRRVIGSLRRLIQRVTLCPGQVKVLWMSTMPHPWCKSGDAHCIRLMNYWRNNGAIRAINQFMAAEIARLGSREIKVLDSHGVIVPRFSFEEFVCVDHFMCNDPPRGLVTTPSGVALAIEVLLLACDGVGTGLSGLNKQMQGRDLYYRDGGVHFLRETGQTYIVTLGCRRLVPDSATLKYMDIASVSKEAVSSDVLMEIPTCHRPEFPSLRSGSLLQVYSSKSVFVMDAGKRRPIDNAALLTELGLTFDNVTFVLEEDLLPIPTGNPISSKRECKECGDVKR